MKKLHLILAVVFVIANTAHAQTAADSAAVLQTLDSWNRGWAEANAALAVEAYAEDADWTNALGTRFQGRDALAARGRSRDGRVAARLGQMQGAATQAMPEHR